MLYIVVSTYPGHHGPISPLLAGKRTKRGNEDTEEPGVNSGARPRVVATVKGLFRSIVSVLRFPSR